MRIIHITDISDIIEKITVLWIVICFQCRHECAFEGLGSNVSCSRCWKQQQNPSIPDCLWRHNKGAVINTRGPDYDKVQAVTAMKCFSGNGLQWTRCTPLYLVWPSTKQLNRAKWPLRFAESCNSSVSRRAVTWKIMRIIGINRIIQKDNKIIDLPVFLQHC